MEETKQMCEKCGTEMVMMDEVMVCPVCSKEAEETAEVADESTESTDEAAA